MEKYQKILTIILSGILFIAFLIFLVIDIKNMNIMSKSVLSLLVYSSLISFILVSYYAHYRFFKTKTKRVLKACLILLIGFFSVMMNEKINKLSENITLLKYSIVFRKEESIDNGDEFVQYLIDNLTDQNIVVGKGEKLSDILKKYDFKDQTVLMTLTAENVDKSIRSIEFRLLEEENYKTHMIKLRSNLTMIGIVSSFFFTVLTIKE